MNKELYEIPHYNGHNLSEVIFTLFENFEKVMQSESENDKIKYTRL